mgnify:CR=1 FL=1
MENTSLGDRMKRYEGVTDTALVRRCPVIGRVDGKAFHTLTKGLSKPWDAGFVQAMQLTAQHLAGSIQGCVLAYVYSDEISLLLTDYEQINTDAWFGYRLQKMCSIASAEASVFFSQQFGRKGLFDARFFNLPENDVVNYFVWRQQDCVRNSVSSLAQSLYSHQDLLGKDSASQHDMMMAKGTNWNFVPTHLKRGSTVVGGQLNLEPPTFTANREYITSLLPVV